MKIIKFIFVSIICLFISGCLKPAYSEYPSIALSSQDKKIVYSGLGISSGTATIGAITGLAALVTENTQLNTWNQNYCTVANSTCRETFNHQEKQRYYLANTTVWLWISAGIIGTATAIYTIVAKTRPPQSSTSVKP